MASTRIDLLDAALLRLLHKGLALQHSGDFNGVRAGGDPAATGTERGGEVYRPAAAARGIGV
jgi:hypothetical protein